MERVEKLRHISEQEFASLGMQDVAYVKRVMVDDEPVYAVFAADGTQIAAMQDREVAFAAVRQHEIEPVSVH
jgi:hypothetical protein